VTHPIIERIRSLVPGASFVLSACVAATDPDEADLNAGLEELKGDPSFRFEMRTGDAQKITRLPG
jgi:hypothetical protein